MINDPYGDQTDARAPRLRVLSGGQEIAGVVKASVTNNNYYNCDHFNVCFAASAMPATWWDIDTPLMVDIQVAINGTDWQSLIIGEVDQQHFHPTSGLLEMEGRDISARMIEAKTQETFLNKTSSEVVAIIAAKHPEITATKITKTTNLVGRYYERDHSKITLDEFSKTTTEWDLLIFLAQNEAFDVFVYGTTLFFQPTTDPLADPYVLNYTPPGPLPRMNAVSMAFERSLTLAKDVEVQIKVWNSREGRGFTKTARAVGGKAAAASGSNRSTRTQRYIKSKPNLTEDAAQKLATQLAHEITLHERVVNVELPGEMTLTPRNMVKVQGTGTSFDQTYYIASIDRSISADEGFRESLRLKNTSPRTQTQV